MYHHSAKMISTYNVDFILNFWYVGLITSYVKVHHNFWMLLYSFEWLQSLFYHISSKLSETLGSPLWSQLFHTQIIIIRLSNSWLQTSGTENEDGIDLVSVNSDDQSQDSGVQDATPDSNQIVGRLMQIRDYLKQATNIMESLDKDSVSEMRSKILTAAY